MSHSLWKSWGLALGLLLVTAFQLWDIAGVPFHPDETSMLYQSRDLETLFTSPGSLAWSPDREQSTELSYRLLNAPLPKYVLGLGRWFGGIGPDEVSVDWDWSEGWLANLRRGALPTERALLAGRSASSALLPVGALFLGRVGKRLAGTWVGVVAAGLLGLNSLVLVHGRRAMAEGTLTFALCFALWTILEGDKRPWLAGIGAGLALSAKHSLLPLVPVGLLAALWPLRSSPTPRQRLVALGAFSTAFFAITLALNPVLWSEPLSAASQIVQARRSLVQDQVQAQAVADRASISVPLRGTDRLAVLVAHVFLAPPQFEEIGNYRSELAESVARYLALPGHALFRGYALGALSLGLMLAGLGSGLVAMRNRSMVESRPAALLLLSTGALALSLYIGIPLPYQRYYMPLVPLVCLWSGLALVSLARQMKKLPVLRAALG